MRMIVEIMHLGDQVVLVAATARVDGMMYPLGFTRVGAHDALRLRTLHYDIRDPRSGVRPDFLSAKIVELNDDPSHYRVECKLTKDP